MTKVWSAGGDPPAGHRGEGGGRKRREDTASRQDRRVVKDKLLREESEWAEGMRPSTH